MEITFHCRNSQIQHSRSRTVSPSIAGHRESNVKGSAASLLSPRIPPATTFIVHFIARDEIHLRRDALVLVVHASSASPRLHLRLSDHFAVEFLLRSARLHQVCLTLPISRPSPRSVLIGSGVFSVPGAFGIYSGFGGSGFFDWVTVLRVRA